MSTKVCEYTVSEAIVDNEASFVSSIRTYGNLGPFRPRDRSEFKGIRLFDILLRQNQIVHGSTVTDDGLSESLYGNWGVIVGKGEILQAYPYDATSYVENGESHSPYSWRNKNIPIEEQVRHAIKYRAGHNEVNIALGRGSISGLFFGEKGEVVDGIDHPSDSVLAMIESLEIPKYQLRDSQFYAIRPDGDVSTEPTHPLEISKYGVSLSHQQAESMKQSLASKLLLPPRNAVSSGYKFGQVHSDIYQTKHDILPQFVSTTQEMMFSTEMDVRHFGYLALYAFDIQNPGAIDTDTLRLIAKTQEVCSELAQRILPDGQLQVTRDDIDFYLANGAAPDYLGKM